jgi:hypothetical protein
MDTETSRMATEPVERDGVTADVSPALTRHRKRHALAKSALRRSISDVTHAMLPLCDMLDELRRELSQAEQQLAADEPSGPDASNPLPTHSTLRRSWCEELPAAVALLVVTTKRFREDVSDVTSIDWDLWFQTRDRDAVMATLVAQQAAAPANRE